MTPPSSGSVRESFQGAAALGAAARSSGPARESVGAEGQGVGEGAGHAILGALCILVFATGLSTFWSPSINATIISGYEIVFVLVYAILS